MCHKILQIKAFPYLGLPSPNEGARGPETGASRKLNSWQRDWGRGCFVCLQNKHCLFSEFLKMGFRPRSWHSKGTCFGDTLACPQDPETKGKILLVG